MAGNLLRDLVTTPSGQLIPNFRSFRLFHDGDTIVRLAAASGALAVILGAYGAHNSSVRDDKERYDVYQTANRYHFFHTLALLGVPCCTFPTTATSFMSLGMVLFCGTCYHTAFTGKKTFSRLAPIGGTCLIFGWLCMIL